MATISIDEAETRFEELARLAENGETVVVTRDGKPVFDIVPHKRRGGIDWEGGRKYKREHGIDQIFGPVPDDFDDPLPEDFLLRPLPE